MLESQEKKKKEKDVCLKRTYLCDPRRTSRRESSCCSSYLSTSPRGREWVNKRYIDEQITSPKEESHTQRREIREEESGQTHTPERERETHTHHCPSVATGTRSIRISSERARGRRGKRRKERDHQLHRHSRIQISCSMCGSSQGFTVSTPPLLYHPTIILILL